MRDSLRHFIAEFVGTFALVFVGGGAILMAQQGIGNLGSVVRRLAKVWRSSDRQRVVIGCENLRKVGQHVR